MVFRYFRIKFLLQILASLVPIVGAGTYTLRSGKAYEFSQELMLCDFHFYFKDLGCMKYFLIINLVLAGGKFYQFFFGTTGGNVFSM